MDENKVQPVSQIWALGATADVNHQITAICWPMSISTAKGIFFTFIFFCFLFLFLNHTESNWHKANTLDAGLSWASMKYEDNAVLKNKKASDFETVAHFL